MKRPLEIIGATDIADLPELGWHNVPVRVDSGEATSAIHCSRVKLVEKEADKGNIALPEYIKLLLMDYIGKRDKNGA